MNLACVHKNGTVCILQRKNMGQIVGCRGDWNGRASGVCMMVHGVQLGTTQRAYITLCEYVEEAPAKVEVGLVGRESDVTLVELKLTCDVSGGIMVAMQRTYIGTYYIEMCCAILCWQQWMRLQAMNICEGKTLFVSSIYIYIYICI